MALRGETKKHWDDQPFSLKHSPYLANTGSGLFRRARLYFDRRGNLVHSSELQGELQQFKVHPERSRADLLKDLCESARENFDEGLRSETALLRHIYKLDEKHHRVRGQDPQYMTKLRRALTKQNGPILQR